MCNSPNGPRKKRGHVGLGSDVFVGLGTTEHANGAFLLLEGRKRAANAANRVFSRGAGKDPAGPES